MSTINERIKEVLEQSGLTKTAFGESLKVSQQYISKLIKTGNPSDLLIDDICQKYNVNENWLRYGEGEMFIKMDSTDIAFNHFGYIMGNATAQKKAVLSALVEMVYCVPDDKWDYIFNQFESCLKEARENNEGEGED